MRYCGQLERTATVSAAAAPASATNWGVPCKSEVSDIGSSRFGCQMTSRWSSAEQRGHLAAKGCPVFVMEFINYSINLDDPMSLTSLLHGVPQFWTARGCQVIFGWSSSSRRPTRQHLADFGSSVVCVKLIVMIFLWVVLCRLSLSCGPYMR